MQWISGEIINQRIGNTTKIVQYLNLQEGAYRGTVLDCGDVHQLQRLDKYKSTKDDENV